MTYTTELAEALVGGDRRALARAMTLVESIRADHRDDAVRLLEEVQHRTGGSVRVGISGAPGVGKSSLIEALGLLLIDEGHHVAVLAVDPSSRRSGGSILGDKTRMSELARSEAAFIRPSPSRGDVGGIAGRSREVSLLCEAAGYDVVLVETVGVGQTEAAVADMADTFVLLVAPAGGDELQGVKRGIMELADLVAVTKADGDLLPAARRAEADHRQAVTLLRRRHPSWAVEVLATSAQTGTGIAQLWDAIGRHREVLLAAGALEPLRAEQAVTWMMREVTATMLDRLLADQATRSTLDGLTAAVRSGRMTSARAAQLLLAAGR